MYVSRGYESPNVGLPFVVGIGVDERAGETVAVGAIFVVITLLADTVGDDGSTVLLKAT